MPKSKHSVKTPKLKHSSKRPFRSLSPPPFELALGRLIGPSAASVNGDLPPPPPYTPSVHYSANDGSLDRLFEWARGLHQWPLEIGFDHRSPQPHPSPPPSEGDFRLCFHDLVWQDQFVALHRVAEIDEMRELIDFQDSRGFTPLHVAIQSGHLRFLEHLVELGADLEIQDGMGYTPFHLLCKLHDLSESSRSTFLWLAEPPNLETPTNWGVTPFHTACLQRKPDLACLLLLNGAHYSPPRHGVLPLYLACQSGILPFLKKVVNFLEEDAASIRHLFEHTEAFQGRTPLHVACTTGDETVVGFLLEKLSVHRRCLLPPGRARRATNLGSSIAKDHGRPNPTQLLRRITPPLDSPDEDGNTALHLTASGNHPSVASLLLDSGAYPHIVNRDGLTPFQIGCIHGHLPIVQLLLEEFPNVVYRDFGPASVLLAAQNCNTAVVFYLLRRHPWILDRIVE